MKYRCPYCREQFQKAQAHCPKCGKAMNVPTRMLDIPLRVQRRAKEQIRRDAERVRSRLSKADFKFGTKPSHVFALLLVMAIVGGLIVGASNRKSNPGADSALNAKAGREVTTLQAAVEAFRITCRRYPTESEGLYSLIHNPGQESWNGPYVSMIHPDPWGGQYRYSVTNEQARVFSCGKDGKPLTGDDILPSESGVRQMLGGRPAFD
jgi:general secretion pathway protein G